MLGGGLFIFCDTDSFFTNGYLKKNIHIILEVTYHVGKVKKYISFIITSNCDLLLVSELDDFTRQTRLYNSLVSKSTYKRFQRIYN